MSDSYSDTSDSDTSDSDDDSSTSSDGSVPSATIVTAPDNQAFSRYYLNLLDKKVKKPTYIQGSLWGMDLTAHLTDQTLESLVLLPFEKSVYENGRITTELTKMTMLENGGWTPEKAKNKDMGCMAFLRKCQTKQLFKAAVQDAARNIPVDWGLIWTNALSETRKWSCRTLPHKDFEPLWKKYEKELKEQLPWLEEQISQGSKPPKYTTLRKHVRVGIVCVWLLLHYRVCESLDAAFDFLKSQPRPLQQEKTALKGVMSAIAEKQRGTEELENKTLTKVKKYWKKDLFEQRIRANSLGKTNEFPGVVAARQNKFFTETYARWQANKGHRNLPDVNRKVLVMLVVTDDNGNTFADSMVTKRHSNPVGCWLTSLVEDNKWPAIQGKHASVWDRSSKAWKKLDPKLTLNANGVLSGDVIDISPDTLEPRDLSPSDWYSLPKKGGAKNDSTPEGIRRLIYLTEHVAEPAQQLLINNEKGRDHAREETKQQLDNLPNETGGTGGQLSVTPLVSTTTETAKTTEKTKHPESRIDNEKGQDRARKELTRGLELANSNLLGENGGSRFLLAQPSESATTENAKTTEKTKNPETPLDDNDNDRAPADDSFFGDDGEDGDKDLFSSDDDNDEDDTDIGTHYVVIKICDDKGGDVLKRQVIPTQPVSTLCKALFERNKDTTIGDDCNLCYYKYDMTHYHFEKLSVGKETTWSELEIRRDEFIYLTIDKEPVAHPIQKFIDIRLPTKMLSSQRFFLTTGFHWDLSKIWKEAGEEGDYTLSYYNGVDWQVINDEVSDDKQLVWAQLPLWDREDLLCITMRKRETSLEFNKWSDDEEPCTVVEVKQHWPIHSLLDQYNKKHVYVCDKDMDEQHWEAVDVNGTWESSGIKPYNHVFFSMEERAPVWQPRSEGSNEYPSNKPKQPEQALDTTNELNQPEPEFNTNAQDPRAPLHKIRVVLHTDTKTVLHQHTLGETKLSSFALSAWHRSSGYDGTPPPTDLKCYHAYPTGRFARLSVDDSMDSILADYQDPYIFITPSEDWPKSQLPQTTPSENEPRINGPVNNSPSAVVNTPDPVAEALANLPACVFEETRTQSLDNARGRALVGYVKGKLSTPAKKIDVAFLIFLVLTFKYRFHQGPGEKREDKHIVWIVLHLMRSFADAEAMAKAQPSKLSSVVAKVENQQLTVHEMWVLVNSAKIIVERFGGQLPLDPYHLAEVFRLNTQNKDILPVAPPMEAGTQARRFLDCMLDCMLRLHGQDGEFAINSQPTEMNAAMEEELGKVTVLMTPSTGRKRSADAAELDQQH